MEKLTDDQRRKLSPSAAEHYEARLFAELHPEFYQCQANATKMVKWLEKRGMSCTLDNFEKAYAALNKAGDLMPGAQALQAMSADEVLELAERVGEPVYDFAGRIIGHDLPRALATNNTGRKFQAAVTGGEEFEYKEFCKLNNFREGE